MKMFKKLLAVTLAGVLALSVLTGCGSSSSKSMVEALNDVGGGLKFTLDPDASTHVTSANVKKFESKINEFAADKDSKDLPTDELVGYAMAAMIRESMPAKNSITVENEAVYAVVNNSLSVKKQATEALKNTKKMTAKIDDEGDWNVDIEPYKLSANENGYEVVYATVTIADRGTFTLISFTEA